MTITDHAITIAGLRAERDTLAFRLGETVAALADVTEAMHLRSGAADRITAERDALAAALAARTAERDEAVTALVNTAAKHGEELARVTADRDRASAQVDRIEAIVNRLPPIDRTMDTADNLRRAIEHLASERDGAVKAREAMAEDLREAREQSRRCVEEGNVESRKLDEARAEVEKLKSELFRAQRDEREIRDAMAATANALACGHSAAAVVNAIAALRQRVADLEARPVLTVDALAVALDASYGIDGTSDRSRAEWVVSRLGAVTLPAQDRSEEFLSHFFDALFPGLKPRDTDKVLGKDRTVQVAAVKHALASLGAAPTTPPADVFAGVTIGTLESVYRTGETTCRSNKEAVHLGCCRYAGIRAVLDRLAVSLITPVDPEVVAKAYHGSRRSPVVEWNCLESGHGEGQARAIEAMRAALTTAGIPVTPERGQ